MMPEFLLENGLSEGTHACNYLLTTDMEMEPVEGYDFANWEAGYGDFHMVPDENTIRMASWLDKTAIVIWQCRGPSQAPQRYTPNSF